MNNIGYAYNRLTKYKEAQDYYTQAREMVQKSGRRTVPQIWIGSRYVGGCDDLYALERQGKLDPLLEATS